MIVSSKLYDVLESGHVKLAVSKEDILPLRGEHVISAQQCLR
jgi:hypothetical protein